MSINGPINLNQVAGENRGVFLRSVRSRECLNVEVCIHYGFVKRNDLQMSKMMNIELWFLCSLHLLYWQ